MHANFGNFWLNTCLHLPYNNKLFGSNSERESDLGGAVTILTCKEVFYNTVSGATVVMCSGQHDGAVLSAVVVQLFGVVSL